MLPRVARSMDPRQHVAQRALPGQWCIVEHQVGVLPFRLGLGIDLVQDEAVQLPVEGGVVRVAGQVIAPLHLVPEQSHGGVYGVVDDDTRGRVAVDGGEDGQVVPQRLVERAQVTVLMCFDLM